MDLLVLSYEAAVDQFLGAPPLFVNPYGALLDLQSALFFRTDNTTYPDSSTVPLPLRTFPRASNASPGLELILSFKSETRRASVCALHAYRPFPWGGI